MIDIKSIVLNTPAEALEDVLSPFIEEQFPSFMRNDYRKLVLFIKAYYEWAEKQGNPSFVNQKIDTAIDIDNNLFEFYEHFKSMYLDGFPDTLAVNIDGIAPNKKTLIKKIKTFYANKGTESAYRFLFRLLFDSGVEFNYPKNFILRASDGLWVEEKSVKVTRSNEQLHPSLKGGTIQQYGGEDNTVLLGYANIDRVHSYFQDGVPVTELYLTNIVGTFTPNSSVRLSPPNESGVPAFNEITYSVLGEFFVQTPGENYIVGDVVFVTTGGVGFSAKVEQTGLAGAVKRIRIENSGVNYFDSVSAVVVSSNGSNNVCRVLLTPTAITNYPGYYKTNRGKISSTQRLYDGDEYQEYSYRLKSAVSIDRYYDVLRKLVHPAGMKMFGSILLENFVNSPSFGSSQVTRVGIPVIGNYTPYTFGTTFDLRNNGQTAAGKWIFNYGGVTYGTTGDLYPAGYNPYIGSSAEIGPSGISSPIGTLFRQGGSGGATGLGYTYAYVPEGGTVAHNPLGAPLGGVTAWKLNRESALTPELVGTSPEAIIGLTLWLKPENIGVCGGSMITGRSMDIWRDASPSQNHAVPPKWDLWDNETVLFAQKRAGGNSWNVSLWNTNPCDNLEFKVGSYGSPIEGVSHGSAFMTGFWGLGGTGPLGTGGNSVSRGYERLDFSFYTVVNYFTGVGVLVAYEMGRTGGSNTTIYGNNIATPNRYTRDTILGLSHDKVNNQVRYYRKNPDPGATVEILRTVGVSAGETFYFDSSWAHIGSAAQILKAQNGGIDLPVSGWTGTSGLFFSLVKGVTVDKLRPTLVVADRGIAGRTGIAFNGGVVYGPQTVWRQSGLCGGTLGLAGVFASPYTEGSCTEGETLGANGAAPFVSGLRGESIQSGTFFTLTRGITLTKDMSAFIVFRAGVTANGATAAGYMGANYGLGFVSSSKPFWDFQSPIRIPHTNLITDTPTYTNSVGFGNRWVNFSAGLGSPMVKTLNVGWNPERVPKRNATRFNFKLNGGTTAGHISMVSYSPSINGLVPGSRYGFFVWAKCVDTPTAKIVCRHFAGSNYTDFNLTTTWKRFYVEESAFTTSGSIQFGLRGGYSPDGATVDVWGPVIFAGTGLETFKNTETDHAFYHRSYYDIDIDPTKQTPEYYFVNTTTNTSYYPYDTGLVGFRNNVGSTTAARIAFNPYRTTLTGVSTENISVGEWRRETDNRIRSFYSGNESENYAVATSRRIARSSSPGGSSPLNVAESQTVYNSEPISLGRFGAYCLPVLDSPYEYTSPNFVSYALANVPYSFRGVIYEVIVYDRVLTETERQIVYSYLSKKYRLDYVLPLTYSSSHPSAELLGLAYWDISKHPNAVGSSKILSGTSLGTIRIDDFINQQGFIYKSAGTRLPDGTVLGEDTYTAFGE